MEYHEIGERFEYDGVVLEVVEDYSCERCFFYKESFCKLIKPLKYCSLHSRYDNKFIIYKLIEQLKQKVWNRKGKSR